MINSASNYPLSILFNPDQNLQYTIPKYQREYVWQEKNWEALFDDIIENDKGHFLGSIICISHTPDALQTAQLELVDGQQRITTTSLLYAAIFTWLKQSVNSAEPSNRRIWGEIDNIQYRLAQKNDLNVLRLSPSLQGKNFSDYEFVMRQSGVLEREVDRPTGHFGKRRIDRAYRYFLARLNQKDEYGTPYFDMTKVLLFLEKLNAASLVKIEVSSHSDAFTLFETLNNRGEPLSALDLIKNKLLDVLDKKSISTIEQNFDRWTRLLDNLTDDSRTQQRYLRHYYNAFKYLPTISVRGYSKATRSNLIDIYGRLIDEDVRFIFDDLYDKSKLYSRLVKHDSPENTAIITNTLVDLDRIGGIPSLTFLMQLLATYPSMSDIQLAPIIRLIVVFFVRRNVTDTPSTRDLDKLFIELIDWCRNLDTWPTVNDIRTFLKQPVWYVSDEIFKAKLLGNIYQDNVDAARFLLCSLEAEHQTHERYTDLWKRYESGQFVWTIEHILPQGKNMPMSWVNMIAEGDVPKANQLRETYAHQLGNLTISGYNSTLGNLSFTEKRDRLDQQKRPVGYCNGLFLNQALVGKDNWSVNDIKQRTEELATQCLQLFAL